VIFTRPIKWIMSLLLVMGLVALGNGTLHAQQDGRYFGQTGYSVENNAIWSYFQGRGGVDTFGYPVSGTFQFQGFEVQIFQRHVLQAFNAQARPLNLLDPDLMPVTRYNESQFPQHDATVADAAPQTDAPNYAQAVQQHLVAYVPNQWDGAAVGFREYFLSAAPPGAANPELVALEIWGFPTSQPARDPGNLNFVYQRFQRGIMHYDATTGVTRGILLGDAFASLLRGQDMPSDFAGDMAGSPFFTLYDPQDPDGLARTVPGVSPPITRQNTDLSGAFVDAGDPPTVDTVLLYFVAIGDDGQRGEAFGCNDSLVAVEHSIEPATAPLRAAYEALLAIDAEQYPGTDLTNALSGWNLQVDSLSLENGEAQVYLSGTWTWVGGVCEVPRVQRQLEDVALQFGTVDSVQVYINNTSLEELFDES
jgi:hypothetical protein